MSKRLTCTLVATVAAAALALAGSALAADSPSGSQSPDDFLTWHGITLYGAVDVNLVDETHGAPTARQLRRWPNICSPRAATATP